MKEDQEREVIFALVVIFLIILLFASIWFGFLMEMKGL